MDGVEMDLGRFRFETFAELKQYCHLVAGVVGLACIRIWGYRDARALTAAEDCGVAFQLTNVLRDLREDAARGRVYLPAEDFRRFACHEGDLTAGVSHDALRELMAYQVARAEDYFVRARRLHDDLYPNGRRIFAAMYGIYRELLARIKARNGDPFGPTIRVPHWRRLMILAGLSLPATAQINR
jgi:phytoene synthase